MVAQFNIFKPPDLIQFQVAADSRPVYWRGCLRFSNRRLPSWSDARICTFSQPWMPITAHKQRNGPWSSTWTAPWARATTPKNAVHEYLKTHSEFEIDKSIQLKLLITVAPYDHKWRLFKITAYYYSKYKFLVAHMLWITIPPPFEKGGARGDLVVVGSL